MGSHATVRAVSGPQHDTSVVVYKPGDSRQHGRVKRGCPNRCRLDAFGDQFPDIREPHVAAFRRVIQQTTAIPTLIARFRIGCISISTTVVEIDKVTGKLSAFFLMGFPRKGGSHSMPVSSVLPRSRIATLTPTRKPPPAPLHPAATAGAAVFSTPVGR